MTAPAEDPRGGMGRHRAPPPTAKPPDRWIAPIAVAAVLLTSASLIAIYATGIAPDASAAGRHGLAVSTVARSARTVHVPLTVLPVPVPVVGDEGAWDPDEGLPKPAPENAVSRPVPFAGVQGHAQAPVTTPTGLSAAPSPIETSPDSPHATETPDTTPTSPAETAAVSEEPASSETTEETTVTPEPTAEPTPTDIGDVIDEVLGTEETP